MISAPCGSLCTFQGILYPLSTTVILKFTPQTESPPDFPHQPSLELKLSLIKVNLPVPKGSKQFLKPK